MPELPEVETTVRCALVPAMQGRKITAAFVGGVMIYGTMAIASRFGQTELPGGELPA